MSINETTSYVVKLAIDYRVVIPLEFPYNYCNYFMSCTFFVFIAQPGRVVTLVPTDDENAVVHGVAYKIPHEKRQEVIEHLDYREKNGYERLLVPFHALDPTNESNTIENICIYVATKENDSYAGHKNDLNDIANQIFEAHGPSGSNREYVFRLADAMRQLFPHHNDDHLFELEKLLKERERKSFSG